MDFLPKPTRGQESHPIPGLNWVWDRDAGLDWLRISPADRWQIPDFIIDAFEVEGFLWGSRGVSYNTIHFEYHPDLRAIFDLEREYKAYLSYATYPHHLGFTLKWGLLAGDNQRCQYLRASGLTFPYALGYVAIVENRRFYVNGKRKPSPPTEVGEFWIV